MKKIIILVLALLFLAACVKNNQQDNHMTNNIRRATVAGQFYPADAKRLEDKIKGYLMNVEANRPSVPYETGQDLVVKAVIVPHAGYEYSAPVAAYAYKAIEGRNYDNVILIGNSHTTYFNGVAIDDSDEWATPLGKVAVNRELTDELVRSSDIIKLNSDTHEDEHSLEVQLPFLQTVLSPGFKIVPMLFGNAGVEDYRKLAQALADNLGENDLIVISTDLSHYPSYVNANKIDKETLSLITTTRIDDLEKHIRSIEQQDIPGEDTLICGVDGVKTIMELSQIKVWEKVETLNYANSGDSPIGDKSRVVGYGAIAFYQSQNTQPIVHNIVSELDESQKKKLLDLARKTVEYYVREGKVLEVDIQDERLDQSEGAFVTLHKSGQLRGCIGIIMPAADPLWKTVQDMAIAAATQDYRFSPVSADELPFLEYEISVLSQPEKINDYKQIELGKHGVIVSKGRQSGVFLPQVAAETGWSLDEFMSELCSQKAGLDPACYKYDNDVVIKIFTAQVFGEK